MSLFEQLKEAAPQEWLRYTRHAFVEALGDGTLTEGAFRAYLIQDYLFLIQFARAKGLAIYKANGLADMRRSAAGVSAILEQEMALHVGYCRDWGLGEAEMAVAAEAPATLAYTRYVLERGMAGDLLDLEIAMSPCLLGYAEIGVRLDRARRHSGRPRHPYDSWIDLYCGDAYVALARETEQAIDRLGARRGGAARFGELAQSFAVATRLEADFWQSALDHPEGPVG